MTDTRLIRSFLEPRHTSLAERAADLARAIAERPDPADDAAARTEARALVAQAPYRERRWALLATALYQAGRQSEALGTLQRARTMLVEQLGLDPSPDLIEIEQKLLRQDPSLRRPAGTPASDICPYRGLLPYDADDADARIRRVPTRDPYSPRESSPGPVTPSRSGIVS